MEAGANLIEFVARADFEAADFSVSLLHSLSPGPQRSTGIELSKGANPILLLLMLMILLTQSNLESKSKSMSKSKRQRISPNSMAVPQRSATRALAGFLEGQTQSPLEMSIRRLAVSTRGLEPCSITILPPSSDWSQPIE
jgi:hypothetical protein